jgi:hypothetical protein
VSARVYANWDRVEACWGPAGGSSALLREVSRGATAFYTSPVLASPGQLAGQIARRRALLRDAAIKIGRQREEARTDRLQRRAASLRDPQRNAEDLVAAEAQRLQRAGVSSTQEGSV